MPNKAVLARLFAIAAFLLSTACGSPEFVFPRTNGDQTVLLGSDVSLDASRSGYEDGPDLTYEWELLTKPEGSSAAIADTAAVQTTFTPDLVGKYRVLLYVDDGNGRSTPARADISVRNNVEPVADAGTQSRALVGKMAKLDGSGSADDDGDVLAFAWTIKSQPTGSAVTLVDGGTAKPTFEPTEAGTYELGLTVSDDWATSTEDTVEVDVVATNKAPVADGADTTYYVLIDAVATLDGNQSSDDDVGDDVFLTYQWDLAQKPHNSETVLKDTKGVTTTFTPDKVGEYTFELVVNDGIVDSKPAKVVIAAVPELP